MTKIGLNGPMTNKAKVSNYFLGLIIATNNFAFEVKSPSQRKKIPCTSWVEMGLRVSSRHSLQRTKLKGQTEMNCYRESHKIQQCLQLTISLLKDLPAKTYLLKID